MAPQYSKIGNTVYKKLLQNLYQIFIRPKSVDPDSMRHEFILNVILCTSTIATGIASVATLANVYTKHGTLKLLLLLPMMCFMAVTAILIWISRKGHYLFVAAVLIASLILTASCLMLSWSFLLPIVPITFVLAIVMSGVLFKARIALVTSGLSTVIVLSIGLAQVNQSLNPYVGWLNHSLDLVDVIGYIVAFNVIGTVTWLANREIDSSLSRARQSEHNLQLERDNLEVKVADRTQELKTAQMVRIMELQRLSEYGRMGMSLLHDVANPLTVATLNIEQLCYKHEPELIDQLSRSVQYIERYVQAARKQMKTGGEVTKFQINDEIEQVISIVQYRAKLNRITIEHRALAKLELQGDPVKFNQLIANLVINAIESYTDTAKVRKVRINYQCTKSLLELTVQDWGKGIAATDLTNIFEPFFSTKSKNNQNMGIGLSMVKRYVEEEFSGTISVSSTISKGTKFVVRLPLSKAHHKYKHYTQSDTISSQSTTIKR